MRRIILGTLVAVAALACCVGGASARRLNLSAQTFRVTWQEWTPEIGYGELTIRVSCPVTLEGSFHSRTIAKTVGTLLGYFTRATIGEAACRSREWPEARLRLLAETLPWHVRYRSFSGLLPNITAVAFDVVSPAIRVTGLPFSGSCLYRATAAAPLGDQFDLTAGGVASYRTGGFIPLAEGNFLCAETAYLSGSGGTVTVQGGASRITVTLI
jgi:hypothetical protein